MAQPRIQAMAVVMFFAVILALAQQGDSQQQVAPTVYLSDVTTLSTTPYSYTRKTNYSVPHMVAFQVNILSGSRYLSFGNVAPTVTVDTTGPGTTSYVCFCLMSAAAFNNIKTQVAGMTDAQIRSFYQAACQPSGTSLSLSVVTPTSSTSRSFTQAARSLNTTVSADTVSYTSLAGVYVDLYTSVLGNVGSSGGQLYIVTEFMASLNAPTSPVGVTTSFSIFASNSNGAADPPAPPSPPLAAQQPQCTIPLMLLAMLLAALLAVLH